MSDTIQLDLTTREEFIHQCPKCEGRFNYPARGTTSTPPFIYDMCPFCGNPLEPIGYQSDYSVNSLLLYGPSQGAEYENSTTE
jgi:hypothetical protein